VTQRTLQKWHGAGNDFVVEVASEPTVAYWNAQRVVALCDRHRGVGADGLLIATLDNGEITMTLLNADGSRAEMSGNGIRCLVAAVRRATNDAREVFAVQTDAGVRDVTLALDGDVGYGTVSMGTVTLEAPLFGAEGVARVGNPHVVVMDRDKWSDPQREAVAADLAVQVGGANVEFATVVNSQRVCIKVVERGVGWTLACGTGSVATAAVLHSKGVVGERVVVENPGGELTVQLNGDQAILGGPVAFVADLSWASA
jgi:diaminopimelate epimerase